MRDDIFTDIPVQYEHISAATKKLSFNMSSDLYTGSLLKTLVASKLAGRILELGTGGGLATSWILEGMDQQSHLITVENNQVLIDIAKSQLPDNRIEFICADGYEWLQNYSGEKFDLIFADAMPGKYDLFEETIALVKEGGFYIIDDMLPQLNWPEGHALKAEIFINELEKRRDIVLTKLNWSTGIIIVTKISNN
ncbi:MAG TPA: class I SAM-dependent methyltransferase [Panacibacter sp.]|nr:class I SAM-dependent methyltransferase [Panacibacter sp.]